jgi:hypothetical protein
MNQPTPAWAQRRRNWALLYGTVFVVFGILSNFPGLYGLNPPWDAMLPWVSLGLPAIGLILFIVGLKRAFGQPDIYRGTILGSILTAFSVLLLGGSVWFHHHLKDLPASAGAPHVGQKAPDFSLSDTNGKTVSLSELLSTPIDTASAKVPKAVLLVFYRGYW